MFIKIYYIHGLWLCLKLFARSVLCFQDRRQEFFVFKQMNFFIFRQMSCCLKWPNIYMRERERLNDKAKWEFLSDFSLKTICVLFPMPAAGARAHSVWFFISIVSYFRIINRCAVGSFNQELGGDCFDSISDSGGRFAEDKKANTIIIRVAQSWALSVFFKFFY